MRRSRLRGAASPLTLDPMASGFRVIWCGQPAGSLIPVPGGWQVTLANIRWQFAGAAPCRAVCVPSRAEAYDLLACTLRHHPPGSRAVLPALLGLSPAPGPG